MTKPKPHSAQRLRLGHQESIPLCPACGSTRPRKSLILCRQCQLLVPEYIRVEAYEQAKKDRQSIHVGDTAARVIAACCMRKREAMRRAA